jgi:hypothetical protein
MLFVINFILFVLSRYRASSKLFTHMRQNYVGQKSSNYLLGFMALVSSANIMGSVKVFIVGGRSFIYSMKREGPRIDPLGIPYFVANQFEKKCRLFFCDFNSTVCFLSVR